MSLIKRQIIKKTPLSTSKVIFDEAGISNISKSTRCRILRSVAKMQKAKPAPPLSTINKVKRLDWAKRYLKMDFGHVLFTDECRASLDGPDGWAQGWVHNEDTFPERLRRQQGGGGVMFWAGIIGNDILGPFRFDDGIKITSEHYIQILNNHILPLKNQLPKK